MSFRRFAPAFPFAACCALVAAAALHQPAANAATVRRYDISSVAVCSAPLPVYDATLRRRPLGILNEGTKPVFVSCSLPVDGATDQVGSTMFIMMKNFGSTDATTNCTLNAGTRYENKVGSVTASATLHADSYEDAVFFGGIDRMSSAGSINFSCVLPPNVELGTIEWDVNSSSNGL